MEGDPVTLWRIQHRKARVFPTTPCHNPSPPFISHLVFSTKDRHPFLRDLAIRTETHAYLGGISKQLDCTPVIIGGVDDHVHILANHARTITQADWVKELKRVSSLWIKQHDPSLRDFVWQSGYGIFSVSSSNPETVE